MYSFLAKIGKNTVKSKKIAQNGGFLRVMVVFCGVGWCLWGFKCRYGQNVEKWVRLMGVFVCGLGACCVVGE